MTKKHNTRSEAQRATQERNYRIFLLRGMAANAALFTDDRHATFVALVDAQLTAMGALTTDEHSKANWPDLHCPY